MLDTLARLATRRLVARSGLGSALEALDARTLLAADLGIELTSSLPSFVVPGDKLVLAARVTNLGDAPMSGPVTVRFLGPDASGAPSQVATITRSLSLAPGKSSVLSTRWTVTDAAPPGEHDFKALLDPSAFTGAAGNDIATHEGGLTIRYLFGTFANRRNVALSTTDEDGTLVTFTLKGPGHGEFRPAEFEGQRAGLDLIGTNGTTQLAIITKGGDGAATLDNAINVAGSLRRIHAKGIDFTGSITVAGWLGEFASRDVEELDMTIAGAGAPMRFLAREVSNVRLATATPLSQLDVASWQWLVAAGDQSPDATSTITAPWIGRLAVKRDFSAVVSLTGVGAPANVLSAARIGGTFGGQFTVVGNIGSFTASTVDSGMLISSGTVAAFTAVTTTVGSIWARSLLRLDLGNARNVDVAAGCTFDVTALPAIAAGNGEVVTWGAGSIAAITVRGSLSAARFACGVDPGDGTVLNADDRLAGRGNIGKIEIRAAGDDILFAATSPPSSARIGGTLVRTELDSRFMWLDDSELPA